MFYFKSRDPFPGEEGAKKLGGENKMVEYDLWTNHVDKKSSATSIATGLPWDECSSTIFVPCKAPGNFGAAPPRKNQNKNQSSGKKSKHDGDNRVKPNELKSITPPAGVDPNENVDFFWDLEDDIRHGTNTFFISVYFTIFRTKLLLHSIA